MAERIEVKFVMRKYNISNKTKISSKIGEKPDFFIYEDERRKIRTGKVAGIRAGFSSKDSLKKHFNAPLVVNLKGKIRKVIDGNHRLQAILDKLQKDKDFSIVVWIAEYKDLTRAEEREVYSRWNSGTAETATDYLKWHWKTIPLGEKILKELPTSVYGSNNKIGIKAFVGALMEAKKQKRFTGQYAGGGAKIVSELRELTDKDIKMLKAFYIDMVEIFGVFFKGNMWYSSGGLSAFMRIWYDNMEIPRPTFIKLFRTAFASRQVLWVELLKSNSRDTAQFLYKRAIEQLNTMKKNVQFKSDSDLIELKVEVE